MTFAKAARYKKRDTLTNIQWRPSSAMLHLAFGRPSAARYALPTSRSYVTLAEASRYNTRDDPFERLLKLHATRCHSRGVQLQQTIACVSPSKTQTNHREALGSPLDSAAELKDW